jgi:hypothetical protein
VGSQSKTSRKYCAASAWSVVKTESGGGTCIKFLLLGHIRRTCSKSSSSPQCGHVESVPWTLFWFPLVVWSNYSLVGQAKVFLPSRSALKAPERAIFVHRRCANMARQSILDLILNQAFNYLKEYPPPLRTVVRTKTGSPPDLLIRPLIPEKAAMNGKP